MSDLRENSTKKNKNITHQNSILILLILFVTFTIILWQTKMKTSFQVSFWSIIFWALVTFYTTESLFLLCKVLQAIINKYCFGNEIYRVMQTGQSQNIVHTLPTCCQLLATSWLTVSRSADSWWEISRKSNSLPTDNIGLWKTLHPFSYHCLPFSAFDKQPYTVNCFNDFYWL